MIRCQICGKKFKSIANLSKHIKGHKISSKKYYDEYLKELHEGICLMYGQIPSCKKYTKFTSLSEGYLNYCSVKCVRLDPNIQSKYQKTCINKFGVNNPSKSELVKSKKRNTLESHFGKNHPMSHNKIQSKRIELCQKKYKKDHSSQVLQVKEKNRKTSQKNFLPTIKKFSQENNIKLIDEYKNAHTVHDWRCTKCNCIFKQRWNDIQQKKYTCPKCYPRNQGYSRGENELGNWLQSLGFNIVRKDKNNIQKELDIYIPELKIAIEYDGLWYHSKNAQDKYNPNSKKDVKLKQLIKTELCTRKNIQLVHIFEDEWLLYQIQMKKLLYNILFEGYDLVNNDCDTITLNRRFSKNPEYYEKLGYEVKIIGPRLYPNKERYKIWDVGYLQLKKLNSY